MKSGTFSLELIDAETKEPMKEFTAPDGKVYVEASPDLEYFIRCRDERAASINDGTVAKFFVDGTYLGYGWKFVSETGDKGLWKRQNGFDTFYALKFILRKRIPGAHNASSSSDTMTPMGNVKVTFHEPRYFEVMQELVDCDRTSCFDGKQSSAPTVSSAKKKLFASIPGSTSCSNNASKKIKKWECGSCLGEMTIHYTSALGLSELGILAPIPAAAVDNSSSATRTTRNNTQDDGDNDDVVITEPKPKRARTATTHRVVSPSGGQSDNSIDLKGTVGADVCRSIDLTGTDDDLGARSGEVIDLTGDD